jgi:hypothetical protein
MQGTKIQHSNSKTLFLGKHLKTVTKPAPIYGACAKILANKSHGCGNQRYWSISGGNLQVGGEGGQARL